MINNQITSGIVSQQTEGVGNSSIMPTAPLLADTGAGSGNSERNYSAPAANLASAGCVVERMEEVCYPEAMQLTFDACGHE